MREETTRTQRIRQGTPPLSLRPVLHTRPLPGASPALLRFGLAVAIGGGLFLRLWQLNALGFNSDEAVYAGQAAAIAGDAALRPYFPMFRAHPLLFQFVVSLGFLGGVSDLVARLISVVFGLATVVMTYQLGRVLYGQAAGVIAALILAFMPYHVVVTRQMILDGPMTLMATLSLYSLARFATSERPEWLYAAGSSMGLTFLTKETGVILIGAIYAFLALSPSVRVRIRDLFISIGCLVAVAAAFPVAISLAGGGGASKTQSYLIWQLLRVPNHPWTFYPTQLPGAIGPLVLVAAALGLWFLRRERSWREVLLAAWITVPALFFQFWPVKGFQYLLPAAPALAVLAARGLARLLASGRITIWSRQFKTAWASYACVAVVVVSLVLPSWGRVQAVSSGPILAGAGGVPGGRAAGQWVAANTPEGSRFLTIGPSMANIIQFYGHRRAMGISVSTNPLRRNPSYQPVVNPDYQLRAGEFHYIIFDAFSASRSKYYSSKIMEYVEKYRGRMVHQEVVRVRTEGGGVAERPVIVIYEVAP